MGGADYEYWAERLAAEKLTPAKLDGKAQVMMVAAAGKFMGVRFQELSVSVLLSTAVDADLPNACFLVQAFNSNRFFAFCERVLFATPYVHAQVNIRHTMPAAVRVARQGNTLFHAEMKDFTSGRMPQREGEEGWECCVNLPLRDPSKADSGKLFYARLSGMTRAYSFLKGEDTFTIQDSQIDVFRLLLDSQFVPQEWLIREDASHAKSKTYPRGKFSPLASRK